MSSSRQALERVLELIDAAPLNPATWQQLLHYKNTHKDLFTVKPLAVLISGVSVLAKRLADDKTGALLATANAEVRDILLRLARSPNNPALLCDIGEVYLREFNLPEIAEAHFKEALRLGGDTPKISAQLAAVGMARRESLTAKPNDSGIYVPVHQSPTPSSLIKQTSKITQRLVLWNQDPRTETTTPPRIAMPTIKKVDANLLVSKAIAAVDEGRLEDAAVMCTQVTQSAPQHPHLWDAWTHLGTSYYEQGNGPLAMTSYQQAQKLRPESMISWFNLGVACQLSGDYKFALNCYNTADRLDPNNPKVSCNMGVVYFNLENYAAAQRCCEKAVKLKPDYARAWDNLAAALGAQDKLNEAIAACENAIKAQYDFPEAWLKLGIIYFNRDEYANAEIAFQKASNLEGCRAYCLSYLAMIHARQNELAEARALCEQVLEVDQLCEIAWLAWNETAVAYYEIDRLADALECTQMAARLRPDIARVWFNLGLVHQRALQYDSSRQAYQHAVKIDPNDTIAWHNLGIVCLELKDMAAAKQAFDSEHQLTQQLPRRVDVRPDFTVTG